MTCHEDLKRLYQKIEPTVTDHFEIEDVGGADELIHQLSHRRISLGLYFEKDRAVVTLSADLSRKTSPEEIASELSDFVILREQIRARGYHSTEKFSGYDIGIDITYEIP